MENHRMMSDTFYDKPTIIATMKIAMQRLRTNGMLVPTVVAALRARGVHITRARFDDLFLQRPERDVSAPLPLFETVIALLFEFHPHVLATAEFCRLAIAMRVPFSDYATYAHYFPPDEWQQIMHGYGLEVASLQSASTIVGRDRELAQWHDAVLLRQNIGIYGVAGVGKSAFARELLRTVEQHLGTPIYTIDGRQIDSWQACIDQLLHVLRIPPVIAEMTVTQLATVIAHEHPYLLISDIDAVRGITAAQILTMLHTHFPELRCVVTARELHLPGYTEIVLSGLSAAHVRAPACQLFTQIRAATPHATLSSDEVMRICRLLHGLPLALVVAANLPDIPSDSQSVFTAMHQLRTSMTDVEYRVFTLLLLFQAPVSQRFIELFGGVACGADMLRIRRALAMLGERQLMVVLTRRENDLYQIPTGLYAALQSHIVMGVAAFHVQDLLQAVLRFDWRWEDTYHLQNVLLTRHELCLLVEYVDILLARGATAAATKVLIHFHGVWRRLGMSTHIHARVTRCVALLATDTPAALHYLHACTTLDCDDAQTALVYMQQAFSAEMLDPDALLRARMTLDMTMILFQAYPQLTDTQIAQLTTDLAWAHRIFGTQQLPAWQARVENAQSFLCWSIGDMRSALAHSDTAMRFFNVTGQSLGFLDTILQRGLVLTSIGDVRGARNYLTQAQRAFAQLDMPIQVAFCSLRIASSYAYERDLAQVRHTIRTMISTGDCFVSRRITFYVLDILAALMVLAPAAVRDGQYLFELTSQFRTAMHDYRGASLGVVLHQRIYNETHTTSTALWVDAQMTFSDVLQQLALFASEPPATT